MAVDHLKVVVAVGKDDGAIADKVHAPDTDQAHGNRTEEELESVNRVSTIISHSRDSGTHLDIHVFPSFLR